MRAVAVFARTLSCLAIAIAAASCGGSSDGPNGPRALTNAIVYISNKTGKSVISVMNGNGDIVQRVTSTEGPKTDPVISPDGKRIVYTAGSVDAGTNSPLWIVNVDGTGLKQLTTDGSEDYRPTWSPDGSQIAFVSMRDGNAEIYVMNADGSGQTNITNDSATDDSPSWSPDGNSILFGSNREAGETAIYSMTPSGGNVTRLVDGYNPEWSPTGTRFLYEDASQIWICETAPGCTVHQVTTDANFHFTPGWSPDESKLVFASAVTGNEEIWTVNSTDGGNATQLTPDSDGDNYTPSWTRH